MGNNAVSPYQQVIEKTKSLSFRSQVLAMNIEKKQAQSTKTEVSNTCTYKCRKSTTSIMLLKATFPSLVDQITLKVNRNKGQFKVVQMIGSEQQKMLMNNH